MSRENDFDANLYAAFIEGKTTNEETRMVLKRMLKSPELRIILNMAAAFCQSEEHILLHGENLR